MFRRSARDRLLTRIRLTWDFKRACERHPESETVSVKQTHAKAKTVNKANYLAGKFVIPKIEEECECNTTDEPSSQNSNFSMPSGILKGKASLP